MCIRVVDYFRFCSQKFFPLCIAGFYKHSQRTSHYQLWEVRCRFKVFVLSIGHCITPPIFVVITTIHRLWIFWFRRLQYFQALNWFICKATPLGQFVSDWRGVTLAYIMKPQKSLFLCISFIPSCIVVNFRGGPVDENFYRKCNEMSFSHFDYFVFVKGACGVAAISNILILFPNYVKRVRSH